MQSNYEPELERGESSDSTDDEDLAAIREAIEEWRSGNDPGVPLAEAFNQIRRALGIPEIQDE